jgi:hypothetical protein
MSVRFNELIFLWGLGVIQPASAREILLFIKSIFAEMQDLPDAKDLTSTLERWQSGGQIFLVDERHQYYSLGYKGNHLLSVRQRRLRDKNRLFLLHAARSARLVSSGGAPKGLAGVSPAVDGSSGIQGARPINPAAVPLRDALSALNDGRLYWPRVFKQLQVGSDRRPPDFFLPLYSFPSVDGVHAASDRAAEGNDLSISDLGFALGISPRLLTSFMHRPTKHYREFTIGKRGGGDRLISSPRVFLKVVQHWILDYFLVALPISAHSHAYRSGASIVTHASIHVAKAFVANADIKNFFPSLRPEAIARVLQNAGLGPQLSAAIARIATLNNGLPQGAPTSPALSNLFLAKFDSDMAAVCEGETLAYSRYADDITISGQNREAIVRALRRAEALLASLDLYLNQDKTRIASQSGQQRVTGVVVNVKAQPPRNLRRKVRAMFHRAAQGRAVAMDLRLRLAGYVNYFNSFPALKDAVPMHRFRTALARFKE